MKLFAENILIREMEDFVKMESSSNDKFCSLDMLAEVASATLQNDPTLIPNLPIKKSKNFKIGSSVPRKSVNSCEKLTLDQIQKLSDKNLIEMFSEQTADEMKRNYSFQCFLIPDKCSQTFKSFGNETRARYKMKAHLLSHLKDLAAANALNNQDVFMAEPLHVRKKKLKEFNQKGTRKKKKIKQNKMKKVNNLELSTKTAEDFYLLQGQHHDAETDIDMLNPTSEMKYNHFNSGKSRCVTENIIHDCVNQSTSTHQNLPYFTSYESICDSEAEQVILKGQSSSDDFNNVVPKNRVKRKRSKHSDSRISSALETHSFLKHSSHYAGNSSHLNCDSRSESEASLSVHHDHTYTSVNGKTLNCDLSSVCESNRSSKAWIDSLHPKKVAHHHCKKKEPLTIPTPPFPYVYEPLLPHIALIQEVGFKKKSCKCMNYITEGLREFSSSPKYVPLFLPKDNEHLKNASYESSIKVGMHTKDDNIPSDSCNGDFSEDGSNSETKDVKFPDSSSSIDDLLKPECPENLKAVEKV